MSNSLPDFFDRTTLRKELRQKRRILSHSDQHHAAKNLFHLLGKEMFFIKAKRIAFYFANDGEIDPLALLFKALAMNKQCYLPVLAPRPSGRLQFAAFRNGDALRPNRWGILEPDTFPRKIISPRALDLVLVPLVGFDRRCARLGMGKGFYDRSFAFKSRLGTSRPMLVGLAHECQKVDAIPSNSWDVPLDAVVTAEKIYRH